MGKTKKPNRILGLMIILVSVFSITNGQLFCGMFSDMYRYLEGNGSIFNISGRVAAIIEALGAEGRFDNYLIFEAIAIYFSFASLILFMIVGIVMLFKRINRETVKVILIATILGFLSIIMKYVALVCVGIDNDSSEMALLIFESLFLYLFSFQNIILVLILMVLFYYSRVNRSNIKLVREGGAELIEKMRYEYLNNKISEREYKNRIAEVISQIEAVSVDLDRESVSYVTDEACDDELPEL